MGSRAVGVAFEAEKHMREQLTYDVDAILSWSFVAALMPHVFSPKIDPMTVFTVARREGKKKWLEEVGVHYLHLLALIGSIPPSTGMEH